MPMLRKGRRGADGDDFGEGEVRASPTRTVISWACHEGTELPVLSVLVRRAPWPRRPSRTGRSSAGGRWRRCPG